MKRLIYGGVVVLSLSGLLLAQGRGRGRGGAEDQQPPVQMTTAQRFRSIQCRTF